MVSPEVLRRHSLFAGIDPALFRDLAMTADEVALQAGEWFFEEGDEADALYLLESGKIDLKIDLDNTGDQRADLNTLVAGEVFGWSALVEPYIYTLGAIAATDVKAIRLNGLSLRQMMASNPEMGYTIMTQLAAALGERLTNLRVQFVSMT